MKRHRVLACPKCGAGDQRDEWVETAVALRVEKQQLEERIAQMEREWDEAEDREQRLQEALRAMQTPEQRQRISQGSGLSAFIREALAAGGPETQPG